MVAAKEEETVKVGVESGTVKMPTAKLMALLHGLQGALRKKHGDNDDDDALNLKECKIIWIKKKNFGIVTMFVFRFKLLFGMDMDFYFVKVTPVA